MTSFANLDALVTAQVATTLSQDDADAVYALVAELSQIEPKIAGILLGAIAVTDDDGAVPGEARVTLVGTPADAPTLKIILLAAGKVDVEFWALRNGVSTRLQRITRSAEFTFA